MIKLSREKYMQAIKFIENNARPLEKALFNYHFNNGSKELVLSELAKFQNPDGGFGHGLESDVRLNASSSFVTSVSFQVLRELNVSHKNNIVKKAINYLLVNYKPEFKGWLPFPPQVDDEPRAMWWNYFANEDNKYNANPSAEIAGYLAKYKELVPEDIINDTLGAALKYLENMPDTIEMHDALCYLRVAKALPKEQGGTVFESLRKRIRSTIEFSPEKWPGYGARPLTYVNSPSDELATVITEEELNVNLDYIINEQTEDGSWAPRWNWGRFPEDWEKAKIEWSGVITLDNLKILKAFNRIEE